jgi:Protein of unknown function (DUF3349)
MALPPFLSSVIGWLRAGYPEGVPDVDYVPLFALLGSQLSENDVKAIAEELESESKPESVEAISQAIANGHRPPGERRRRGPGPVPSGRGRLAAGQARAFRPGELALDRPAASRQPQADRADRSTARQLGRGRLDFSPLPAPGRPQYLGPTNSSSRVTASRRATDIELRRE